MSGNLVTFIENTEKIRPLHSEYESKCLKYLSEKHSLDFDYINKNVTGSIDIHDLVRKIRTNYRQSRSNFGYFLSKYSTWLSGQCLNLPKKRGRKRKIRISEKTADECLNTVLEYLKQDGMIDKGIYIEFTLRSIMIKVTLLDKFHVSMYAMPNLHLRD